MPIVVSCIKKTFKEKLLLILTIKRIFNFCVILSITALCTLTALALFVAYRRFEFAIDNFKYKRMGWIDRRRLLRSHQRRWTESFGYPFYTCWAAVFLTLLSIVMCMLAEKYDIEYIKENHFLWGKLNKPHWFLIVAVWLV